MNEWLKALAYAERQTRRCSDLAMKFLPDNAATEKVRAHLDHAVLEMKLAWVEADQSLNPEGAKAEPPSFDGRGNWVAPYNQCPECDHHDHKKDCSIAKGCYCCVPTGRSRI